MENKASKIFTNFFEVELCFAEEERESESESVVWLFYLNEGFDDEVPWLPIG